VTRRFFLAVAILGTAACIDLATDPDEIVAIEFTELPWPSVVAGDTLRDAAGAVTPLAARLFAGDGSEVVGGPLEFLVEEGGVTLGDGNLLIADDTASGTARLRASTSGVQSSPRQIDVVAQPDSMEASGTIAPLEWVVPDNAQSNTSGPLGVNVLSTNDDETTSGVRAWIVTFQLESEGIAIAPSDTSGVFLVNDGGRPSYADTTDAQGKASRRVRIRITPGFTPPDSVIVTVRAGYRGAPLSGGPVQLVLPLRPG